MASPIRIPEGYAAIEGEGVTLIAPAADLAELKDAGLHHPASWRGTAADRKNGPGRGAVSPFQLPGGRRLMLKQLRRGGLAARFGKERFHGTGRLLANLTLPPELSRRGVATPGAACLLLQEGPAGLFRGWLATREVRNATDALTWLSESGAGGAGVLDPVLRFVRSVHDAGLQHRDLNLGNLMVRPTAGAAEPVAIIDLDGARLHDGVLPFRLRLVSLWRLERSMVKRFGSGVPPGAGYRESWAAAYAEGDTALARRILRWWPVGGILLAAHRAGWGRSGF